MLIIVVGRAAEDDGAVILFIGWRVTYVGGWKRSVNARVNVIRGDRVSGGIWRKISQFSIWKVPNYVLETRDSFPRESVDAIDRLAKFRSVAGTAIVIGAAIYYSGLSHLTEVTTGKHGLKNINLGGGSAGDRSVAVIASVVVAMFGLPLVSLYLVWRANPGARKATVPSSGGPSSLSPGFGAFSRLARPS